MMVALASSERRGGFIAEGVRRLGPTPGRLAFASKLALVCALTTLITQIYQTPAPALAAYVVFFLNKPDRLESLILDVVFTLVMTIIVGIALLLTMFVIDEPLWRVAVMSAFSVGFLFVAFASKLRPLGAIVALIVGYALDLLGMYHSGEIATRALLYAWLFIAIPAGVSAAVNLLLGPSPRRLAERAIAERLRAAATVLRRPDQPTREGFTESLREGIGEIQAWLKLAAMERTSPPQDLAALRQAAQSTAAILSWVEVVSRDGAALIPGSLLRRVAQTLEQMARVLIKGGYPIEIALESGADTTVQLPPQSLRLWLDICNLLARFAEPPPPDALSGPPAVAPARAPEHPPVQRPGSAPGGFFLPDAFTSPEHIRYALKTTGAAMFCYVLYSLLDWPGIHTCFITCYIVSLGTAAETIEKLTLRICGCIVGGAAGIVAIVYVLPHATSNQALLCVVFLGALASGWVAAGSPRISYAGFQMAFAFFLCAIQGPSPAFDLTVARDRLIGILLGNVVVYLLFTRVWPVSVAERIDPAIAAVLRQLSAMTVAVGSAERDSLAAQAQGALGAIEQNLDLAGYEPPALRPSETWFAARRRATREIAALQGPLFLSAGPELGLSSEATRRLEQVADTLHARGPRTAGPLGETPAVEHGVITLRDNDRARPQSNGATPRLSPDRGPLAEMIQTHLDSLERIWGGHCPCPAASPSPAASESAPSHVAS